jgi:hypothetical protein
MRDTPLTLAGTHDPEQPTIRVSQPTPVVPDTIELYPGLYLEIGSTQNQMSKEQANGYALMRYRLMPNDVVTYFILSRDPAEMDPGHRMAVAELIVIKLQMFANQHFLQNCHVGTVFLRDGQGMESPSDDNETTQRKLMDLYHHLRPSGASDATYALWLLEKITTEAQGFVTAIHDIEHWAMGHPVGNLELYIELLRQLVLDGSETSSIHDLCKAEIEQRWSRLLPDAIEVSEIVANPLIEGHPIGFTVEPVDTCDQVLQRHRLIAGGDYPVLGGVRKDYPIEWRGDQALIAFTNPFKSSVPKED